MGLFSKVFGTYSEKEIKRITPIVDKICSYRDEMTALSDEELRGKHRSSRSVWKKAKHWMIFCRKLMRLCVKLPEEY